MRAPALAITGEPGLDRTVPVDLTRRYLDCLPGTEHVVLDRTGHMGTVTRPAAFASLVASFIARTAERAIVARLTGWLDRCRRFRFTTFADRPAGSRRCSTSPRGCPMALLRAAVVFAHPHPQQGGTMHTKAVFRATKALASIGCAVLRFNFRGVGSSEGAWDEGRGEREDFRAGLDMHGLALSRAASCGRPGFSFGAWIALTEGAVDQRVSVLLGIAPAIAMYDFSALKVSTKPKFIIHGERDELFPLKSMYEFYAQLHEPKELAVIDAADHLFDGKVSEVGDAVEDLLGDFKTPTN